MKPTPDNQPLPGEAFERAEETETPKYTVVRVDGISQVYRYGERRGPANNCEAQLADDLADMTAQRDEAIANEQERWQNRIDHVLGIHVPNAKIDGGGCDSGDPLDFSESELHQAFQYLEAQRDAKDAECQRLKESVEYWKGQWNNQTAEHDKLRAEVEHRTKQRDAFQNLFSEASEAFNERGRQITRLTTELDAVRKAAVPLCIGKPLIQILAKEGQWASLDGQGIVAADCLFQKDPYEQLAASQARCGALERALGNLLATSTEEPPLITSDASHTDYCVRQIEAEDAARKLLTPSQQPDNFDSSSVESSGDSPAQHPQDVRCHRPNSEQSDGAEVFGKPAPVSVQLNNEVSASPAVTTSPPEPEHVKAWEDTRIIDWLGANHVWLAEKLHDIGWKAPCDAQRDNLKNLLSNLRPLVRLEMAPPIATEEAQ